MTDRYVIRSTLGEMIIFDTKKNDSIKLTDAQMTRFKRTARRFKLMAGEDRPLNFMIDKLCEDFLRERV